MNEATKGKKMSKAPSRAKIIEALNEGSVCFESFRYGLSEYVVFYYAEDFRKARDILKPLYPVDGLSHFCHQGAGPRDETGRKTWYLAPTTGSIFDQDEMLGDWGAIVQ